MSLNSDMTQNYKDFSDYEQPNAKVKVKDFPIGLTTESAELSTLNIWGRINLYLQRNKELNSEIHQ